jgi:hypothetical protein
MKLQTPLLIVFVVISATAIPALSDEVKRNPIQGSVEKHKRAGEKQAQPTALPPGAPRRVQVEQTPAKDRPNPFQSMSQSMPSAAVKEDLRRKNELPSAQTAILTPGAKMNLGGSPAATMRSGTTGTNPKILSPKGPAISRPGGSAFSQ